MVWEVVFMLVVLKIPIAYLCAVVWWAVRAEPAPDLPTDGVPVPVGNTPPPGSRPWRRASGSRPGPSRRPRRAQPHEARSGAPR